MILVTGGDFSSLRAPHIWGPHPTARQRLLDLVNGDTVLLPGGDKAEGSHYCDAWIDARDSAWVAAECLARRVGASVNVLAGHFVNRIAGLAGREFHRVEHIHVC